MRDKLLEEFPALTKKSLKRVFSDKEETYVLKCSNGTVLYAAGDKPPSFFDDGFGNLYPTLFTLWKIPEMMPELVTHGPVSKQLSQTHAPTSTGELSAGPAALACSPPSLPRSLEEALHSLLPHERRRSSLQPALTDSCPLVCRRGLPKAGRR